MGWMERLGMEEGVPIEHRMVTRSIERAQKQVEGRNFEARKHLLEYDDVMNKQREAVYTLRRSILDGREGKDYILNAASEIVDYLFQVHYPEDAKDHPDEAELNAELYDFFGIDLKAAGVDLDETPREAAKEAVLDAVTRRYEQKEAQIGPEMMRLHERYLLLQVIDQLWKDHLLNVDHLKEGIGLRGYGQRDPLVEYKRESFELFQAMKLRVDEEIVRFLWRLRPVLSEEGGGAPLPPRRPAPRQRPPLILSGPSEEPVPAFAGARASAPAVSAGAAAPSRQPPRVGGDDAAVKTIRRDEPKVGRNDPCPCGSGKKYKKCHGTAA